jgi:hypothetical protein
VGKPEGKKPLRRPICRWFDNIKVVLREKEWGDMYWMDMAEDRDQWIAPVNTVMNLLVPQNIGKFLSSCIACDFSRRAPLMKLLLLF